MMMAEKKNRIDAILSNADWPKRTPDVRVTQRELEEAGAATPRPPQALKPRQPLKPKR